MRIMLVADGPQVETGYSRQARSLAWRLARDEHEVFIYAPGGFQGGQYEYTHWDDDIGYQIQVLAANYGDDRAGTDGFPYWVDYVTPDLIITMLDANALGDYPMTGIPTWMWAPIDTWPIPEEECGILARADRILVPSHFGLAQLEARGLVAEHVPYGFEASELYFDAEDRTTFRSNLGINDDTFLVGMIGFHYPYPDRKGYAWAMEAIANFVGNKQDVKVYIQSELCTEPNFLNLRKLRHVFGLDDIVGFSRATGPRYLNNIEMRQMLCGFDVLFSSSISEGFGLPVLEAQVCGTPVVVNAATALTELVGPGGIACQPAGSMVTADISNASIPSVVQLANGLEAMYDDWKNHKIPNHTTIRGHFAPLDWNTLYKNTWGDLLKQVPAPLEIPEVSKRTLVLGCGTRPQDGAVNHDRTKHAEYVDDAWDLENFPWPWVDDAFDMVDMGDVIEHLNAGIPQIMDELWRLIAPGGYLSIRTCEEGSWQFHTDPTHTRAFTIHSFDYFDPDTVLGRDYGEAYTQFHWKLHKRGSLPSGDLIFLLEPRKIKLV